MDQFPEPVLALLRREGTNISWAHLTFNSWVGCQKVSPACDHCYAEADQDHRRHRVAWGPGQERRLAADSTWAKPWRWDRIAGEAGVKLRVFCASLADVFDNAVPDAWRERLANMITGTPNLVWMLLTKRIGNVRSMLQAMFPAGVPANVWLGITVANQDEAERDLPRAVSVKRGLGVTRLFLSCEPLLGPLDLSRWLAVPDGIDLVIVGGESGKDARPMPGEWPDNIQMDCEDAGVVFHFKQWGEWLPWEPGHSRMPDLYVSLSDGSTTPENRVGSRPMMRVGAAKAGRTLRGREYIGVPA